MLYNSQKIKNKTFKNQELQSFLSSLSLVAKHDPVAS